MALDPNTLYPVDYVEPAPEAPPEDGDDNGRNLTRLLQVLRGSVPPGGTPLNKRQLLYIVQGRLAQNGAQTYDAANPAHAADIRIAAAGATAADRDKGINPDPRIIAFTRTELIAAFDHVRGERDDTYVPYVPPSE